MHLQAAAEWKRQATVTEAQGYKEAAIKRAEGDSQALDMLFKIARGIDPKTLQRKYLDALDNSWQKQFYEVYVST